VPIAQAHTHNESQNSRLVNSAGISADDKKTASNHNLSVYAIESASGVTEGGNAINKVNANGKVTNMGTTSTVNNLGSDALKEHVNQ